MRTIEEFKNIEKRKLIARETMEIYAPLTDRMGMNRIRDELEDISFKILNPEARELITKRLIVKEEDRKDTFKKISEEFISILKVNGINVKITGREKTPFSIWRKIQKKRTSLEQISDILGFRVIANSISECYKTLGIFHTRWQTIPGRFKDYISTPKINNYKSIHTAIIGPEKQRVEIQIRTKYMHEFAQRGIASHWKYKSSEKINLSAWKEYDWLVDLVEIIDKGASPEHYYEYTKLQMFQDNVFCFTPEGSVIKLPKDATSIDFAYAVHTHIGDTAIRCEVNGKESSLQSILHNGDMIKIITSDKVSPSLHWLSSAKTGKARAAIRRYWYDKEPTKKINKKYNSALWISLPDFPGKLGEVTSLIGINKGNITSVEMTEKKADHINFVFDIQIDDLKNFTKLISELKQKEFKFRIIRHKKKHALLQRFFKRFKKN
jgi:RelA/SpoT family (p)ppGpp synthetase